MKCWETEPDSRPSFKELCENTSKYTEHIAGYLQVGFNPFNQMECVETTSTQKNEKDKSESAVSIQVIPPSPDTSLVHSTAFSTTD